MVSAPTALFSAFNSGTDATSYTIAASFTPPANSQFTIFIANGAGTAGNNVDPTIGGTLGLTWTKEGSQANNTNNVKGTYWSAKTGSSPPTGTIVANYSTTQSWCQAIGEVWGSSDSTDHVVQVVSAQTTTPDNPGVTLAALQSGSATAGYHNWNSTSAMAVGSGMTAGQTTGSSTSPTGISSSEYDISSPSTTVGWTTTLNLEKLYFGVEIRNAASNVAPTADAGPDQTDLEPGATVQLDGGGSDSDGTIVSYSWNHISGPSSNSDLSSTSAQDPTYLAPNNLSGATDVWRLTVTDDDSATDTDDVSISVLASTERAVSGGVMVGAYWRVP